MLYCYHFFLTWFVRYILTLAIPQSVFPQLKDMYNNCGKGVRLPFWTSGFA